MSLCNNHDHLYFDKLCRTKKSETVLSLIHSTYQAKINNGTKEDIAKHLVNAYELFKFDSGSYKGDMDQFSSQYTIGHELGIWKNASLDLTPLAIKVAKNEITIKEYFDIFFLNYIQPIDGIVYNLLYMILVSANENNIKIITKDDFKKIFSFASKATNNEINGLFNMLLGTSYFKLNDSNSLSIEKDIDYLIKVCDIKFHGKSYDEVREYFDKNQNYLEYLLKDNRIVSHTDKQEENIDNIQNNFKTSEYVGFNKIYYGIPGCGKSYKVSSMLSFKSEFQDEAKMNGIYKKIPSSNIIRTTFYLDYSNSDFVGQIYPVVDDKGTVNYIPIPGPFTKALTKALLHPEEMVYLVIEEINRGNAAAIFGDLFQLLDRVREESDEKIIGESEYPISNEFIEGYFSKIKSGKIVLDDEDGKNLHYKKGCIKIPNNLTIFATMNTDDQNVFSLDTAFKRRWEFERVSSGWEKDDVTGIYKNEILNMCIPFTDWTWGNFASSINVKMIENCKDGIITQDKNLGPFFATKDMLVEKEHRYDDTLENRQRLIKFVNNIVDYLFLDVTKFDHEVLFEKDVTFNNVYDYFVEQLRSDVDFEVAKRYLTIFDNNVQDDVDDSLSKKR